ncbi:MAG: pyruvate dehydrogenase (acetyl-transferring), homodimeric type, partial [Planctomycetales bacterium]|nr:pyruvate dehydrogenase (acetyl-transferring), homodimeric type [Planctomycetales bacterium]
DTAIYYITLENENYEMPPMPEGCEEGIIRGMYKVKSVDAGGPRVQLFGSGPILREVLRAQQMLAEKHGIASDCWSVTSYNQLRRDAQECQRWNMLNPTAPPRKAYVEQALEGAQGPCIASSDYMRVHSEQIAEWCPGGLFALGTDGMGRSESRENLRRHFEVDAECVVIATLYKLSQCGQVEKQQVADAIKDLGVNPEKVSALYA